MGNYHAYSPADEIQQPQTDLFRLFGGFEYRFPILQGHLLFVANPHLVFEGVASISKLVLLGCNPEGLQDFSVYYKGQFGVDGYLVETRLKQPGVSNDLECKVTDFKEDAELVLPADRVNPEVKPEVFQYILSLLNRKFDIVNLQRRYSFLDSKTAAKDRYLQTIDIVQKLRERVFPLAFDGFRIGLSINPVPVRL
jgi:hypothetical protein